ncbi:MAG: carbohydrate kinase family protein [Thermotogae bacterium]|jgi:sugar/nucleoside kinase (ribokinase family)|nr:carbohydrate kinase family protein [Thermotogota bacterium]MCL5032242.1 carbohydrate kinase family protein [Thermotogota bacterium]
MLSVVSLSFHSFLNGNFGFESKMDSQFCNKFNAKKGESIVKDAYVIGNLNLDIVVGYFERWPEVGSNINGNYFDCRYTGAAGNSALTMKQLGFNTHVISTIGDDEVGKRFVDEFKRLGIDLSKCKEVHDKTCISIGILSNEDRTFFTFLGSLNYFDDNFLKEKIENVRDAYVILCGFDVVPVLQNSEIINIMKTLRANKNFILFDPGWPVNGWNEEKTELALKIATLSDIFSPNLKEALAISRKYVLDDALISLKSRSIHNCIVKLGEKGASGFFQGKYVSANAFRVDTIKDTIGAGDMFNSALLKALSENWEIERSLKFATFYASSGITKVGNERYMSFEEAYSTFEKIHC